MKMYIGNLTKRVVDFMYRVDGAQRQQKIEMGSQVRLSGDLTQKQIDSIYEQHQRYGLIPVAEVPKMKAFTGMCFSVDREIPLERIRHGLHQNDIAMAEAGKETRTQAAVALHQELSNNLDPELNAGLRELEVEVIEQKSDTNPDPKISEGIKVKDENGPGAPRAPRGSSRRRRGN